MRPHTFTRLLALAALMTFWSSTLLGQASRDPYTTLPTPIEVTSFPYLETGFDSDETATGTPTGMQGSCNSLACCAGVWYKVTIDTRGSLVSAFEDFTPLGTGIIWYKAESENITTTDQLTYIAGIPNNFCGYAGFTSPSSGYQWRLKYQPDYDNGTTDQPSQSEMSTWTSTRLPDPFPEDLTQYPDNGWRTDVTLESGKHYLEPGTYWLYAWNSNQQNLQSGSATRLVIDFIQLCPEGFTCDNVSETICSSESYTTQNGQLITETSTVEETIGTTITTYNITVDESITCCPDGYTCDVVDVTECSSSIYTTPFGNTITETGAVLDEDTEAKTRTVYNVTFDRAEVTTDVFYDGLIAASGSVSYTAQTNATGVLTFDKDQDYWVNMNALQDDLDGTSRSVFMWVKSEANVVSDDQTLFAINTASGGNVALFKIDNDGENLELFDGSDNQSASFDMGDEQWHYVGYTYDAATTETVIYVDGIENDRFKDNQSTANDSQYSLGQEFDNSNDSDHMNGDMAEISIWDEVLTGAEIREAMKSKINNGHPKYSNLVGYYSVFGGCDDDTSVLKDHSGKGNDGVMMNSFTVDFKNVQPISGFNAIDWYENISWKKDGAEVSTDPTYTFDVAAGDYEFVATRSFIESSDVWTLTANSNATMVDNLMDETLCEDDPITRKVTNVNTVNFLDFEETESNYIEVNSLAEPLAGQSRSIFMWVNKESNVANGDVDQLLSIMSDDGFNAITNLYINSSEKVTVWDGNNTYVSSTSISNDTWYYVGYTYDASTFEGKIYINGVEEKTFTKEMPVSVGNLISLGQRYEENGTGGYLDGKLAEITVWDKVLSEEEVNSLMAAAPAYNAANLVAAYGTFKNIADNRLFDLTANGNDGLASHNTIFVTTEEVELTDYDATKNYFFSWKKEGTEFDTDATGNITIDEGVTNYSVTYGTPLFQKTDEFSISYTNLVPAQPTDQLGLRRADVSFQVDEIPGATYQWYSSELTVSHVNTDNGLASDNVFDVAEYQGYLYYATEEGLSISYDGGLTFVSKNTSHGLGSNVVKAIHVTSGGTIYAATSAGLSVSNDGGETFSNLTTNNGLASNYVTDVWVTSNNTIYVTTISGFNISTDGGQSFTTKTNVDGMTTNHAQKIYITPDEQTIFLIHLSEGFSVSNDGGGTFTSFESIEGQSLSGLAPTIYDIVEYGGVLYYATYYGVYISEDNGVTFTLRTTDHGLAENVTKDIAIGDDGTIYAASDNALSVSTDNGISFQVYSFQGEVFNDAYKAVFLYNNGLQLLSSDSQDIEHPILVKGRALSDTNSSNDWNLIAGANTHQLVLDNLNLDLDQKEYFVQVTKDGCSQISDYAILSVIQAPLIDEVYPSSGSTDVEIDYSLIIEYRDDLDQGTGTMRVYKYETDELVKTYNTEVMLGPDRELDVEGAELIARGGELEYATKYYVLMDQGVVTDEDDYPNRAIVDKDYWTFTTVCEPLILEQPTDQTGVIGQSATFTVPEVAGASYQWFQKGEDAWNTLPSDQNGFPNTVNINTIFVDGDKLYAGTGAGLVISTDGGDNWTTVERDQNGFGTSSVVNSVFAEGNNIYAGTSVGISISTDGGSSWTTTGRGENGFSVANALAGNIVKVNSVYADGNTVYAGMAEGISISTDGGVNWTTTQSGVNGFTNGSVLSIYADGDKVYAGTFNGGLSISTDGGLNWNTISPNPNNNTIPAVFAEGDMVYVGTSGGGASISSDGGQNWRTVNRFENGFSGGFDHYSVYAEGEMVYVATNSGLSISSDGGFNWETVTSGTNGFANSNQVNSVYGQSGQIFAGTTAGISIFGNIRLSNSHEESSSNFIAGANTRELTISNLTEDFDQTEYFVVVTKGDCEETSNTVALTLKEPLTELSLSGSYPSATRDALLDFPYLNLEFSEQIALGTGDVTIYRASDDSVFEVLDITSGTVKNSGRPLQVQLKLSQNWEAGVEYYIQYPRGLITNLAETSEVFAVEDKSFSFQAEKFNESIIDSFYPATGSTDYDVTSLDDLVINTTVPVGLERDLIGYFRIYKASNDELVKTIEEDGENDRDLDYGDDDNYINFEFDVDELEPNTEYYVLIDDGFIVSYDNGLYHVGISDPNTWRFTTASEAPPVEVESFTPESGATGIATDFNAVGLKFSITFQEPMTLATSGQIGSVDIYNASTDELLGSNEFPAGSGSFLADLSTDGLTFSTTFINTEGSGAVELIDGQEYYILISENYIKRASDGATYTITDPTVWSFTVGTPAEPTFTHTTFSPTSGATEVETDILLNPTFNSVIINNPLRINFEDPIAAGTSGTIGIYKASDDSPVVEYNMAAETVGSLQVFNGQASSIGQLKNITIVENLDFAGPMQTIRSGALYISSEDITLENNTEYYVLISEGAIVDGEDASILYEGIADKTTWTFETEAAVEPLAINSLIPADDETDVAIDRYLQIEFDQAIEIGTGNITVYDENDQIFEVIDVAVRGRVRSETRLRVSHDKLFIPLTTYYVLADASVAGGLDGAAFAGISDKTTWTFTIEDFAELDVDEYYPAMGSTNYDVSKGNSFEIDFVSDVDLSNDSDQITGNLRVYKASNDVLVATIEIGDMSLGESGAKFNVSGLEPGTEYYVLFDDGLFVDYEGPDIFAGISDPTVWRFTTLAIPSTPTLTTTRPADDATDVSISANIELTYSENVQANPDAVNNVVLYDADNNVVETFAANTLNYSAAKVTINPTNDLSYNTSYYVLIDNEAFISNNDIKTAAVTDPTVINFTTEGQPNTAPVASNVSFAGNLEANQQLTGSYNYADDDSDAESGSTLQWFVADDATGANRTAISGATSTTFTLTSAEVGKFITFGVTPNDGADAGTRVLATYDGPVVAAVVPTLESTVPADGAVDVAKDANLSFTMSETVTAGTGNITLTPTTGTATVIDVTSNEVTISGTDVTIDPSSDLIEGQFYTVTFDAAAFVDADGNNSAGLTSQTAWNFTIKEANVAPEAQGVSIKKSLVVDGVLEGSYTYFDENDDSESGTTFQWYRADDASGTGRAAISGATTEDYTVVNGDNGKYVSFEVTPNDGSLAGTAEESAFFGPIIINDGVTNIPPAFTSDALTSIFDDETYSYTITYEDLNSDVPTLTKTTGPDWLTVNGFVLSGDPTSANVGDHDVVLTLDDQNGGTKTQEFTIKVLVSNTAPSVNGVEVSGTTTIDEVLTASYNFIDAESDADNSTYKWYRADDENGTGKTEITGATADTYTLVAADAGKFISFEVTPNDGTIDGTLAESTSVGAVAKKIPSLSLSDITKIYGDADFNLSANTNSTGAITYSFDNDLTGASINGATVTLGSVGEITVDVSLAEDAEFQARQVQGTITVDQKAIEVTATDASKAVGENDPTLEFSVTNGAIVGNDEVVSIDRDAGESVGTYAITFTDGADAANYDISTVEGTFTITSNAITITADAATKSYGENDPDFTYTITSGTLNPGDELSGAITRVDGEDVGTYALESSLFNPDYDITFVGADLTIEKAELTATADDLTKTYGEENPELTISYSGFAIGEDENDITAPTIATAIDATTGVGTYDITLTGGSSDNYNISLVDGTLTVNQATLSATADNKTKTYGEDNPEFTITYLGFVNGDDESVLTVPVASTTADETTGIGIYDITLSGGSSENYTIELNDGLFIIDQATLTATADDKTKAYGDANPDFTVTYDGFVNGDDESVLTTVPTASTTADATTGVGVYDIDLSGGNATNYSLITNNGSLTIEKATLTATADDKSKAYGDENPELTISYDGFVNGEDVSALQDGAPFATTTATAASDAGTYAIELQGDDTENYELTLVNGTLTVNQAALTATADDQSKTYGEENPEFTISYSGFVNGDDETAITTAPTASTTADATTSVGVYDITLSGGTANNYSLLTNDGSLTINKATLTVTADDQIKGVGQENPEFTLAYEGFVNGDTEADLDTAPTGSSTADETTGAGNVAITVSGGSDNNYDFSYVDGTLTILDAAFVTSVEVPDAGHYGIGDELSFAVSFNKAIEVSGAATLELTIGNSDRSADFISVSGNGTSLNFTYIIQEGDRDVDGVTVGSLLNLNGGSLKDEIGVDAILSLNNVESTAQVFVDGIRPTPTITGNVGSLTNGAFTATFAFDELVSDFEIGDIVVTNGSASDFSVVISGLIWRATITPTADGTVSISLPTGAANDIAGNSSEASTNSIITTFDGTAPEVTSITRAEADQIPTGTTSRDFTVIFSEEVTGVDLTDFEVVTTGTATATLNTITANSATNYTVNVNGISGEGTIGLNALNDNSIIDAATNELAATFTGQVYTTNFQPTDIGMTSSEIQENNAVGEVVGDFTTTDADAGDSFTYSLVAGTGDTDNASFSIVDGQLLAAEAFDFETKDTYSIRVRTEDNFGGSFEKAITISITNEGEAIIVLVDVDGDFDPTILGLSSTKNWNIRNDGDVATEVRIISSTFGFSINPGSVQLNPGETKPITAVFTPIEAREYSGVVVFNFDVTDVIQDNVIEVNLSGEGVIVTGVDNGQIKEEQINIFPNPASNYVTIDLSELNGMPLDIQMINPTGVSKLEKEGYDQTELTIDVANFESGLYIIQFSNERSLVRKKVLIRK